MAATTLDPGLRPLSDLVCFSHLRWSWVYQRPQHLMSRAARDRRVFIFEEPIEGVGATRPSTSVIRCITCPLPPLACPADCPPLSA